METNPRHLNLLSEFFKDSEEGWAHAITTLEHGIKDVQLYKFDSPPTLFGLMGRKTLIITFTGCERYKIRLLRESKLIYRLEIYPYITHNPEIRSIFSPCFDGNPVSIMEGLGKLVDMARAGMLH